MIYQDALAQSAQDFRSNKTDIALQRMKQLIETDPYDITPFINYSTILVHVGRPEDAEANLIKGILNNPFDYRGHYNLFAIFCKTKKWNKALKQIRRTLSTIKLFCFITQWSAQNIKHLTEVKELWKQNQGAYIIAAIFYKKNNNLEKAIQEITECINTCGQDARLLEIRASLYKEMNMIPQAYNDALAVEKCSFFYKDINDYENDEQIAEEECIKQIEGYIADLNELFKKSTEKVKSKIYTFPEEIIFLENIAKRPINLDEMITQSFQLISSHSLKQLLPPSQKSEPSNEPVEKSVEASEKNEKLEQISQELSKQKGKGSLELYPLNQYHRIEMKVIMAEFQRNTQLIGKMDPYIIFNYGSQKFRTKTIKGGGTNPKWENQTKIFTLSKAPTIMKAEVWDHQFFKRDDLIGRAQILIKETGVKAIKIFYEDKEAGNIYIHIQGIN